MPYGTLIKGLLIPFLGTSFGSAFVFFMKNELSRRLQKALMGFASGIMIAASVWSLIMPAIEQSQKLGRFSAVPAIVGFCIGTVFLLSLDGVSDCFYSSSVNKCSKSVFQKTVMMVIAVVLHNIPEGMAVGVVYAGLISGQTNINELAALTLSVGIAIQNFPEGAIISMPLMSNGIRKTKSFVCGVMSGIVEPIAGIITILLSRFAVAILPYLLGFAAGAMIYVVIAELIPEMMRDKNNYFAVIMFMFGFSVMVFLDVSLG